MFSNLFPKPSNSQNLTAELILQERIKAERKERRPRGPRRGGGKVEKTYSDVDGEPDMIECDICQERLKRHPRWVITNHNRRKHGLGRFLCGICDYKGRFGHELINHMAEVTDFP